MVQLTYIFLFDSLLTFDDDKQPIYTHACSGVILAAASLYQHSPSKCASLTQREASAAQLESTQLTLIGHSWISNFHCWCVATKREGVSRRHFEIHVPCRIRPFQWDHHQPSSSASSPYSEPAWLTWHYRVQIELCSSVRNTKPRFTDIE